MEKVVLIGSGNWGSAIAKIVGQNIQTLDNFDKTVPMWTYEEIFHGQKLTDIINTRHENTKYLPNIRLPDNIVAVPNLSEAVKDATCLIFVIPHQFVKGVCEQLKSKLTKGAKAISLIKGVETSNGLSLISDVIRQELDIDCSVLMGANIAMEVAREQFCESTLGYKNKENAALFFKLFNTHYFRISMVPDIAGPEICGALKNVVAIAAGLVDGMKCGENTKAAIIRIGLLEMRNFSKLFYDGVSDETFFESCGVADLITTCFGGRNRKIAEARVTTGKSFEVLEEELLGGQKIQGSLTAKEIHAVLKSQQATHKFPLFTTVYKICYENAPVSSILSDI